MAKRLSLARGCVKLGVAYALRHALPSWLAALPAVLVFAGIEAIDRAAVVPLVAARAGAGMFGARILDMGLEALGAAAAALILVVTIRRVAGAGEGSLPHEISSAIRVPLVRAAARSSWVVLALLGALYLLLHASGAIIAESGPKNILLLPVFLIVMPLTTGGPIGLLVIGGAIAGLMFALGMLGIYAVRNTLLNSGAQAAGEINVFRAALDRPVGLIRLVLNLTWLYGVPFILLYKWVPSLIFPKIPMPTFADVMKTLENPEAGATVMPLDLVRGLYGGAAISFGIVLAALAAVIAWNKAAEIALSAEGSREVKTVTRHRPWHDPETPLETALQSESRATFGRRGMR
jgi:hypothetical protein